MLVLNDPALADQVADEHIRALVRQRFAELSVDAPYDPNAIGYFVLVEPGDDIAQVERDSDCPLFSSALDEDVQYGDPDYAPSCEFVEEHPNCYEVVFVFSDSAYGRIVFVPKASGIDPVLLRYCAEFATPPLA
jgi:hypothetical protein